MNFSLNSKKMKRSVILRSGHNGWRARLRATYNFSFDWFQKCAEIYNLHERLGYKTPDSAWKHNPVIEGSVYPEDFRKAQKKDW